MSTRGCLRRLLTDLAWIGLPLIAVLGGVAYLGPELVVGRLVASLPGSLALSAVTLWICILFSCKRPARVMVFSLGAALWMLSLTGAASTIAATFVSSALLETRIAATLTIHSLAAFLPCLVLWCMGADRAAFPASATLILGVAVLSHRLQFGSHEPITGPGTLPIWLAAAAPSLLLVLPSRKCTV